MFSGGSVFNKSKLPTTALGIAIDAVRRLMKRKNYALCDGRVYKKAPESMFTYAYCNTVEKFLNASLANSEMANVLTPVLSKVTSLLENPFCRIIKPITIIHNIIEVLPAGTCFVISKKSFVHLKRFATGCTPRAFIHYEFDPMVIPYPRPFIYGE